MTRAISVIHETIGKLSRRNSSVNLIRRYILCDNRAGCHDGPATDPYPRDENGAASDPHIPFDYGGIERRPTCKNDGDSGFVIHMIRPDDGDARTDHRVCPQFDPRADQTVRPDVAIFIGDQV